MNRIVPIALLLLTGPLLQANAWIPSRRIVAVPRLFSSSTDDLTAFASTLDEEDEAPSSTTVKGKTWKDDLDMFIDPTTPVAERQRLLQDILSANEEIRSSVEAALRDRKVRWTMFRSFQKDSASRVTDKICINC
jgi:hypothetical protein